MSQATPKVRPEDLIRPFEGLDLDRCLSNAAKRLKAPLAVLTFDLWYQPRPPAEEGGAPRLASWLVVLDTCGPGRGRCVVFDDGQPIATFAEAPPEFWEGVVGRCLPPADDPWWELAQAEGGAR